MQLLGSGPVLPKIVSAVVLAIPNNPRTPIRIKIPSISVDAYIEQVGLTSDGAVDVPKNPIDAAWFDQSPHPGDVGDSIIDGHYGWKNNMPVVFDSLHNINKGDYIYRGW